jgi:hypothetical protein
MKKICILFLSSIFIFQLSYSQCDSWTGLTNEDEITGWHSIYRQALKAEDYNTAFEYWQKAFNAAPSADGNRDFHFTDGVKLFTHKMKNATSDDEKKMYKAKILSLYDDCVSCYKARSVKLTKCATDSCYDGRIGYVLGRKGFDMYYNLNSPYSQNFSVFSEAVEKAGNGTEYIVLTPFASITVYQFSKEQITKEEARDIHTALNKIADYNIENNAKYSAYYKQAKDAMNAQFAQIERQIFDCEYFKAKLRPEYEANPENPEIIKQTLAILKGQGCDLSDPLVAELDVKWKKYASAENDRIMREFEETNPGVKANRLYKEEKFSEAIDEYKKAIELESDAGKQAGYYFSIASIEFRKMSSYQSARANARKAANLRPGWGAPYSLIGDMYAKSARNCGDSWNQRLAILAALDKYSYAKSIDPNPDMVTDVNRKLGIYRQSMPNQEDGFMRGFKKGQTATVGCWIGETVKVRFK